MSSYLPIAWYQSTRYISQFQCLADKLVLPHDLPWLKFKVPVLLYMPSLGNWSKQTFLFRRKIRKIDIKAWYHKKWETQACNLNNFFWTSLSHSLQQTVVFRRGAERFLIRKIQFPQMFLLDSVPSFCPWLGSTFRKRETWLIGHRLVYTL